MAAKKQKFKRPRPYQSSSKDGVGKVIVTIVLRENNNNYVKGNITKSFTIRDVKVSEVAKVVEEALFGE